MVSHQSKNNALRLRRKHVLQHGDTKYAIKQAQQLTAALSEKLSKFEPFSNNVTEENCVDRLVAHRIVSKFHIANNSSAADLQNAAFESYLLYDKGLKTDIDMSNEILKKARMNLYAWFDKVFRLDVVAYNFQPTPGETFVSSSGEVSLTAKLFNKDHWTTTPNCLEDTCLFIWHNVSFKRAAKRHIGHVTRREKRNLYQRFKHFPDAGFRIFRALLIDRVLTIVDGARASSVPKSNDKRRFINVEAFFPVILQRAVAQGLLEVLRIAGNDLSNQSFAVKPHATTPDVFRPKGMSAQGLHGKMIADRGYSTIDFSNASDSVTVEAVCNLFPRWVADLLCKYRSNYVAIQGELYAPNKLSSMGNGFTFETMTLLLLSIARVFDPTSRVYGDDVIIRDESAIEFVGTCELINFKVNEKKTFIKSFFRESCGYFYSDIHGYIVSFDFNPIESMSDLIITHNKLTIILEENQISPELADTLRFTRDKLNALAHASRKGPLPATDHERRSYLALYMFDSGFSKKQKRSKDLTILRQHYIERNSWFFDWTHVDSKDYALIFIPFFVNDKSGYLSTDGNQCLLPALYAGKRLSAVKRGKGRFVDLPAFVNAEDGNVTLISNLITQQNVWVERLANVLMEHLKA